MLEHPDPFRMPFTPHSKNHTILQLADRLKQAATTSRLCTDTVNDPLEFWFLRKFVAVRKRLMNTLTIYTVVKVRRGKKVREGALHPLHLPHLVQFLEKWSAETVCD